MLKILLVISISLSVLIFLQTKSNYKNITVILYSNKNAGNATSSDTLLSNKRTNISKTKIDVFYCNLNFKLPYYTPTDGIYKTGSKHKECNNSIYPFTVKCYAYDSKNRVVKMTVSGSGTEKIYTYNYDNKNQITEIGDTGQKLLSILYNNDGTISELKEQFLGFERKLVFIYQ